MYVVPGSLLTPDLRIVRPLREGAVGNVWVCEKVSDGSPLAVKFLSEEVLRLSPEALKRFQREAKIAMQLDSPHIVRTYDFGTMQDGTPYIVMELLEGESLGERLERAGPMNPRDVASIVEQVAAALHIAHGMGVVHRDIKPDNIFLVGTGASPRVKVLDFGTVKQIQQRTDSLLTATGMIVGTPEYMSPEQIFAARDVDHRADVWGLGAVAFHALTGRIPFEGDSPHALILAIGNAELTPPSSLDSRLSPEVDAWFARALARSVADRFSTAQEMAAEFRRIWGVDKPAVRDEETQTDLQTLPFQPGMGPDPHAPPSGAPASGATPHSHAAPSAPGLPAPASTPPPTSGGPPPAPSAPASTPSMRDPQASIPSSGAIVGAPQAPVAAATVESALLAATQPGARMSPLAQPSGATMRKALLVGGAVAAVAVTFVVVLVVLFAVGEPAESEASQVDGSREAAETATTAVEDTSALTDDSVAPSAAGESAGAAGGAAADQDAAQPEGPAGYVTIVCEPRCNQVVVQGRALGPSPILKQELPPGKYSFTLKRADGPDKTVDVEVKPNALEQLHVQMD